MKLSIFDFASPEQRRLRAIRKAEEAADIVAKRQTEQQANSMREAEERANSKWFYSERVDELRGTSVSLAQLTSNNSVDLPFPWAGGTRGSIIIRHNGLDCDVLFVVNQGQFRFGRMVYLISSKSDDRKVLEWSANKPPDAKTNVMILNAPKAFIRSVVGAERLIVEGQFYNAGSQQFVFSPLGLEPRFKP